MQSRIEEKSNSISLQSILGDGREGSGVFIEPASQVSLLKPWTLVGVGISNEKKIQISESKIEHVSPYHPSERAYRGSSFEDSVKFSFQHESKQINIEIPRAEILKALNNPKKLPDDKLGVYVSKRILFNSMLESNNPLSITFGLFFGSGYGSRDVAMIFNQQKALESIRITENYKGETVLFLSKHLIPKSEIIEKQRVQREQEGQIEKQREEDRHFKF